MPRKRLAVTETELAVLRVLWERETDTAPSITRVLYPRFSASDLATVHSMLQRLEAKKAVKRNRKTRPHRFQATVSEADLAGHQLKEIADQLSAGSVAPLIMQLVETKKLTKKEADEIRKMLQNYKGS